MIDRYHAIRLFIICIFISLITNFPAAVPTSSLNTALQEFRDFIHNSYRDRGYNFSNETELLIRTAILNSWYLAQFIGAMTLFPLAEIYGRLGAFKIAVAGMAIGNLLQFVASFTALPELFICGRFLAGVLSPLCDTCMIMYFQECTPVHFRGMFSYLSAIGYGTLSAFGMLLGNSFMLGDSLVWLTGVQVPPVFLSLACICLFLHETPKYLAIVNSFKARLDAEHDSACKKAHRIPNPVEHSPIRNMEFGHFGSSGIALFSICQTGVYLSTACLDKDNHCVQIDSVNHVPVHSGHTLWRIQLIPIDDQTGIAVYDHNQIMGSGTASGHTLRTFRVNEKGKIQLLTKCYVGPGVAYRIVPLIFNKHLYYFSEYGSLIDYCYFSGSFQFENNLIPNLKGGDQGAWYQNKFYFLYELKFELTYRPKDYELGVFDMETRRFSILHLPDNIPSNWIRRICKVVSPALIMFIDEHAVLNMLPMDLGRWKECEHIAQATDSRPCPMSLFRIPLRLPETLSNLAYFSFLKKPLYFQEQVELVIQSVYPSHSKRVKSSPRTHRLNYDLNEDKQ